MSVARPGRTNLEKLNLPPSVPSFTSVNAQPCRQFESFLSSPVLVLTRSSGLSTTSANVVTSRIWATSSGMHADKHFRQCRPSGRSQFKRCTRSIPTLPSRQSRECFLRDQCPLGKCKPWERFLPLNSCPTCAPLLQLVSSNSRQQPPALFRSGETRRGWP